MEIRATERWSLWCLMWPRNRADSRFAPGQWETSLQSNAVSHWLGANLESALYKSYWWWVKQCDLWIQCDGLAQERHNSSALAMELHLSCTNPLNGLPNYRSTLVKPPTHPTAMCSMQDLRSTLAWTHWVVDNTGHWGKWANDWRISYLYQEIIC